LKFLFDENLPVPAARALRDVGEPVTHVQFEGLRGSTDQEIARQLATNGWLLVTADNRIRKRVQERAAFAAARAGVFVFSGKAKRTGSDWLALIFRRWPDIKQYAETHEVPCLVLVPDRGAIERLR
jgi:hypothetical protein